MELESSLPEICRIDLLIYGVAYCSWFRVLVTVGVFKCFMVHAKMELHIAPLTSMW
jgi:hypothetical protein